MIETNPKPWFRTTLEQQPALIITALYLFASVVGLVYSWAFLRFFGINVLQYSEIGDFLLASLKEPGIWLLVIFAVVLVQADTALSRYTERRGPGRWLRWYASERYRQINYLILVMMVFTLLFVFANVRFEQIQRGQGVEVRVVLTDDAGSHQRVLLGTTTNYIFVYDRATGQALVHPRENVLVIGTVDERRSGTASAIIDHAAPSTQTDTP